MSETKPCDGKKAVIQTIKSLEAEHRELPEPRPDLAQYLQDGLNVKLDRGEDGRQISIVLVHEDDPTIRMSVRVANICEQDGCFYERGNNGQRERLYKVGWTACGSACREMLSQRAMCDLLVRIALGTDDLDD